MKFYGNINNRMDENGYYNGTYNNIKVGDYATEYLWSDRHAYEVTRVDDQKHIAIRQLKAYRTDDYGMSDTQRYEYESDPNAKEIELQLTNNGWKKVNTYTYETYLKCLDNCRNDTRTEEAAQKLARFYMRANLTEKEWDKLMSGKTIRKVKGNINISFGIADEYYDYSF